MKLEFDNLRIDGELRSRWDVLLRIVGNFTLSVGDRALYREAEFCLVEFAITLANWLTIPPADRSEFVYSSVESDVPGLVRFTRTDGDHWQIGAAHQDHASTAQFTIEEVERASLAYIHDLRERLSKTLDILEYVEEDHVREVMRQKLG